MERDAPLLAMKMEDTVGKESRQPSGAERRPRLTASKEMGAAVRPLQRTKLELNHCHDSEQEVGSRLFSESPSKSPSSQHLALSLLRPQAEDLSKAACTSDLQDSELVNGAA